MLTSAVYLAQVLDDSKVEGGHEQTGFELIMVKTISEHLGGQVWNRSQDQECAEDRVHMGQSHAREAVTVLHADYLSPVRPTIKHTTPRQVQ